MRLIGDVLILAGNAQDAEGRPLFDDAVKDLYLSPKYPQKAVNILKGYGLRLLQVPIVLNLLEADVRSASSKMHGENTTDEWHSAVARLLSILIKDSAHTEQKLKSLPLLPLRSGVWTSTASGPVYFPTTEGIDIPESLELRVVSPSASRNSDRKTLFQQLGICDATKNQVRASIFRSFDSDSLSLNQVQAYLDFLYLTHHVGTHTREGYASVWVGTRALQRKSPHRTDMYLPGTDHAYSPASLLAAKGAAPGLSAEFLHSWHMKHVPDRPSPSHPSWERWLCDSIGILERLRLMSHDKVGLSDTFLYVHEHRPEEFLGLFEHLWLHEKLNLIIDWTLRSKIEELSAENLCRVGFPLKLHETWLPLKSLKELVGRYMEYPEQFPFLKLEESDMTQQVGSKWDFLSDYFSVGRDDSIDFLLQILWCIQQSCPEPSSDHQLQKVFDLYVAISAKHAVSNDSSEARRKIRFVQECFRADASLMTDSRIGNSLMKVAFSILVKRTLGGRTLLFVYGSRHQIWCRHTPLELSTRVEWMLKNSRISRICFRERSAFGMLQWMI